MTEKKWQVSWVVKDPEMAKRMQENPMPPGTIFHLDASKPGTEAFWAAPPKMRMMDVHVMSKNRIHLKPRPQIPGTLKTGVTHVMVDPATELQWDGTVWLKHPRTTKAGRLWVRVKNALVRTWYRRVR